MYSSGGMSSHGGIDEPFCSLRSLRGRRRRACGRRGVLLRRAARGARCRHRDDHARRGGLRRGWGCCRFRRAGCRVARPRSDDTFRPALRNTSSAALAPPARRGGHVGCGRRLLRRVLAARGLLVRVRTRQRPGAVSGDAGAGLPAASRRPSGSCFVRGRLGGRVVPRCQGRCSGFAAFVLLGASIRPTSVARRQPRTFVAAIRSPSLSARRCTRTSLRAIGAAWGKRRCSAGATAAGSLRTGSADAYCLTTALTAGAAVHVRRRARFAEMLRERCRLGTNRRFSRHRWFRRVTTVQQAPPTSTCCESGIAGFASATRTAERTGTAARRVNRGATTPPPAAQSTAGVAGTLRATRPRLALPLAPQPHRRHRRPWAPARTRACATASS